MGSKDNQESLATSYFDQNPGYFRSPVHWRIDWNSLQQCPLCLISMKGDCTAQQKNAGANIWTNVTAGPLWQRHVNTRLLTPAQGLAPLIVPGSNASTIAGTLTEACQHQASSTSCIHAQLPKCPDSISERGNSSVQTTTGWESK